MILAAGAINSPKLLELSGIGDPDVLGRHGIAVRHALTGRRREPAGSPADPHGLPRHRRPHAQPARQQPLSARRRWRRICALPPRAAVDGAEPARHLLAQRRDRGDAPISSTTSSRSRPTSSATRCTPTRRSPCRSATSGRRAAAPCHIRSRDPAEQPAIRLNYLSAARDRARRPRVGAPGAPPRRRRERSAATRPEELLPGPAVTADDDLLARHRRHRHHHLPSGRHLPDGRRRDCRGRCRPARPRTRRACASSMPRSCRRSPRATPPRRS